MLTLFDYPDGHGRLARVRRRPLRSRHRRAPVARCSCSRSRRRRPIPDLRALGPAGADRGGAPPGLAEWNDTAARFRLDGAAGAVRPRADRRAGAGRPRGRRGGCGEERLTYGELDRRAGRAGAPAARPGRRPRGRGWRSARPHGGAAGRPARRLEGAAAPTCRSTRRTPAARLGFLLADAGAAVLVTQAALGASLPAADIPRVLLEDLEDLDVPAPPGPAVLRTTWPT